ncbi:dTDP-4-dehydrorhamnose reductase [Undibacterium sp.]|uniref:dTDP-4-dehydrorhamnose reductase n=1 Tax=Undibacterium sp. TaxID=1914977 RepID=UPI0025FA27BB|nr:dTDP-4-dehydrorhamnose reductase [Undibacterium sp.]
MNILLTGSSGQVGHALKFALIGTGGVIIPLRDQMDLSKPDLLRATIRKVKPDIIINPAAYTAVDQAESDTDLAYAINSIAPGILAEEAKRLNAALIHFSTDYVFDGSKSDSRGDITPYTEQDIPCPINVYGKTKLAGEEAIRSIRCKHLIFRTSWVYSGFGKNFLLTILRLAKERDHLKIVNDQWGAPTCATWIAHTTTEILKQLKKSDNSENWWGENSGLYNMTSSGITNWSEFAKKIIQLGLNCELLSPPISQIEGIPSSEYLTKASRPKNSLLSNKSLEEKFRIQSNSWQEQILNCLNTEFA